MRGEFERRKKDNKERVEDRKSEHVAAVGWRLVNHVSLEGAEYSA